jgi:hypothetical protein
MTTLLTPEEFFRGVSETWDYCLAQASWWVEQLPQQTARLYRVPEWDHAADIFHMKGIGR